MKLIVTDRYGGKYPNLKTMCKGQCEGMGCYPNSKGKFVRCRRCNGTGKEPKKKIKP